MNLKSNLASRRPILENRVFTALFYTVLYITANKDITVILQLTVVIGQVQNHPSKPKSASLHFHYMPSAAPLYRAQLWEFHAMPRGAELSSKKQAQALAVHIDRKHHRDLTAARTVPKRNRKPSFLSIFVRNQEYTHKPTKMTIRDNIRLVRASFQSRKCSRCLQDELKLPSSAGRTRSHPNKRAAPRFKQAKR